MEGRFRSLDELADSLASDSRYGSWKSGALVHREFERLLQALPANEREGFRHTWTGNFDPDGNPLDDPHDRLVALWVALGLTTRDRQRAPKPVCLDELRSADPNRRQVDWLPSDTGVYYDELREFLTRYGGPLPALLDKTARAERHTLVTYSQAIARLQKRFPGLTDGELAMWVSNNWLTAFDRHGAEFSLLDARNLNELRECRFNRHEIDRFWTAYRYLTFEQLCWRWRPFIKDPAHYICDKVVPLSEPAEGQAPDDSRVFFFHGFDPLHRCPEIPVENRLFPLPQIVECEKAEFPDIALPYKRAQTRLSERLDATEHELALWVWMDHLNAYLDEDLSERLHFDPLSGVMDYLNGEARQGTGLNGAYFNRADLETFQPLDRWLTFQQVVARWRDYGDAEVIKGKMRAAEQDDRLMPCHPLGGEAIEQALFTVAQIEALEQFYGWTPEVGLQPGDPDSRLQREVPDAETLDRLLAPVPIADRPWVREEAIAAMLAKRLSPSKLLGDQRWRCSRQVFEIWVKQLSKDTGWPLPAFWADEPTPEPAPSASPSSNAAETPELTEAPEDNPAIRPRSKRDTTAALEGKRCKREEQNKNLKELLEKIVAAGKRNNKPWAEGLGNWRLPFQADAIGEVYKNLHKSGKKAKLPTGRRLKERIQKLDYYPADSRKATFDQQKQELIKLLQENKPIT